MAVKFVVLLVVLGYLQQASGHGMMLDPPNRSSLWRNDWTQPANYNDNQLFCGGAQVQHGQNGGRCGTCGDNYADPVPRSNENTGTFGNGVVLRTYNSGSVINTHVTLTANHMGTFTYSLCVLNDPSRAESEECFTDLPLANGDPVVNVPSGVFNFNNQVRLPAGLTCERCVLRWHYRSGNSWGNCGDGTARLGCGPQETFRSCADITIV